MVEAAVDRGSWACIAAVSQLPSAAQPSSSHLAKILDTAVKSRYNDGGYCIEMLCRLEAAANLSHEQRLQLLGASTDSNRSHLEAEIANLPAAVAVAAAAAVSKRCSCWQRLRAAFTLTTAAIIKLCRSRSWARS
jgi:hypothetical protein